MTERTGTAGGGSAVAMTECGVVAKPSAVAVGSEQPDVTAYSSNRLNQYTLISNSVSSVPSVVNPVYDLNGQQKSAKPKAKPTGDRDFEAARTRGARSRAEKGS